jgi:hypothetical protein
MADADGTYDIGEMGRFLSELDSGAEVVIGDRMDHIEPGAMSWLHRRVGNPGLSAMLNTLYGTGVRDAHCGMRALRRDVLPRLALQANGMELASEMVIRAGKAGVVVREVPISYHRRVGPSKLSTFRDGWRHLRLLLVHAPMYLFVLPGAAMSAVGLASMLVAISHVELFGRQWHVHTTIAGSVFTIVGIQVLSLGVCAQAYAAYFLGERSQWFDRARRRYRLEHGLLAGGATFLVGVGLFAYVFVTWADKGFSSLSEEDLAVFATTLVVVGLQAVFSSFLLSILGLRRPR